MSSYLAARAVYALAYLANWLLWAYWWIIVMRVVASWLNADPGNPIVRFLYSVTEPVLSGLRRRFPFLVVSALDLAPIAVLLGVTVVQIVLVDSLFELAGRLAVGR